MKIVKSGRLFSKLFIVPVVHTVCTGVLKIFYTNVLVKYYGMVTEKSGSAALFLYAFIRVRIMSYKTNTWLAA